MKNLLITFTVLLAISNAFISLQNIVDCKSSFYQILYDYQSQKQNLIEATAKLMKSISPALRTCGMIKFANQLDSQISSACVDDLEKGANIAIRMRQETNNQAKLALDFAIMQRLYKQKLQTECGFLQGTQFNVKSGGVCLESAYKLSLVLQNLTHDLGQGKSADALADLEQFLTQLPDTLDACGQSQWATKVRNDFPVQCLKSIDVLGKELIVLEHNYDHLEWLVKHSKEIAGVFDQVRKNCPIFA